MTSLTNKYSKLQKNQVKFKDDPKEIVYELLNGLNEKLKLSINNIEKKNYKEAKNNAKKAQNIAFALRKSLDHENGGEISENLDYLYGHIQFATDKFIKNDKHDSLNSALYVSNEIFDGWKGPVKKLA